MIGVSSIYYSGKRVTPCEYPELATMQNVNLSPSVTVLAGTCLGQVATSANDVQTLTVSGTPTAGTLTVVFTVDGVSASVVFTMAAGVFPSNATMQTAVRALSIFGAGTVTITGTLGGAANGTIIATYTGFLAARPIQVMTSSNAGLTGGTPVVSVAHTTTGATAGQFAAYASGNSDGTQNWKAIAERDMITDAQGRITFGLQVGGGVHGETFLTAPVWTGGHFQTSELVGLDSTAVTSASGHLIAGTTTSGIVTF